MRRRRRAGRGSQRTSEGGTADLALLEPAGRESRCVLGIRGGRVVFDANGLSIPDVSRAGPYTNFK